MLEQIINLVKQFGKKTVVENEDVPNEHNEDVMADATQTISSGFQNIMAGGGFGNILDLFRGNNNSSGGKGGLLKNPIVTMMIGHFISKLVSKYNMKPAAASQVSNNLIPDVLDNLIHRTKSRAPENDSFDFNDLIGSLTGGNVATAENSKNGFDFQGLLDRLTGGDHSGEENIKAVTEEVTTGARDNQGSGGLMDLIKGLFK